MNLYDFDDPLIEAIDLSAGLGSLGLSHLQGRGIGGMALNALGTGFGGAAGLALAGNKPDGIRAGAGLGGAIS